ncbi:uncharacterized protein LOC133801686 [Humulus lupulus]|uniref:uncharacterized protein LOC133801686 n=1 Tax=Humulus lupulus TaxID=3486 RepID=UPI002B4124E7|nr:uncharacterized protein LOC133801686 [Humulus lupulus]XP_062095925.1 uncharacterized protein LOC133801686 [Humulus lupulus]XP_062095926.1 uncharacterized protein LOC133801686 [Humulus lupulus]
MDVEELDQRKAENSTSIVDESLAQTVVLVKTDEAICHSMENNDLELLDEESKGVVDATGEVSDRVEQGTNNVISTDLAEVLDQIEQGINDNSSDSAVQVAVVETRIVINPSEAAAFAFVSEDSLALGLNAKVDELGFSKVSVEESKRKMPEAEKRSCVIDINCASAKSCENLDGDSVCRICHLTSNPSPDRRTATTSTTDLIHLGCECKEDLGIAHYQCAEAWFKIKGNRMCEICGETAKNVTGVGDVEFIDDWNERRLYMHNGADPSDRSGRCWRGQPFCNFLMACLVIAFVLPWFFRVNMF